MVVFREARGRTVILHVTTTHNLENLLILEELFEKSISAK